MGRRAYGQPQRHGRRILVTLKGWNVTVADRFARGEGPTEFPQLKVSCRLLAVFVRTLRKDKKIGPRRLLKRWLVKPTRDLDAL